MGSVSLVEVTEYFNYDMYGAAVGMQFKIGITQFVHVFLKGIAEIYAKKFILSTSITAEYLYNFWAVCGVMLRMK